MLKTLFILMALFTSLSAFACWKVEGSFAVDGESWKINQKFDHDKEYIFPMGSFIVKMTLKSGKDKTQSLSYVVHEKKGINLTLVTKGNEELKVGESEDIYAKGEAGQPNSIIIIKLTNI